MGRPKKHPELIYKKNRHCCYYLQYHMVLVTKYRHPVIKGNIEIRLHELIKYLLEKADCSLIKVNSDTDYVHIFFEATPQTNLSVVANNIKTVTSRRIRKEFITKLEYYYNEPVLWKQSYFIGIDNDRSMEVIQQYIQMQKE